MTAVALPLGKAAEAVGQSVDTLKRAIHATDPASFPPPLRAKRAGTASNSGYLVLVSELERWVNSLPDA
jgi:hypothetical protein